MFHLKRSIRIAAVLAAAAAVILCVALLVRLSRKNSPQWAVQSSLKRLQNLDDDSIRSLFAFSDAETASQGATAQDIPSYASEAVQLFFKNFTFRIISSKENDSTAEVVVCATNVDARELASEIRLLQLEDSLRISRESTGENSGQGSSDPGSDNIFSLMKKALSKNTFSMTDTEQTITLTQVLGEWTVRSDDSLKKMLTGGLAEELSDPYLLTPEKTLAVYLNQYRTLTEDEWAVLLQADDLFQTSSSDSSSIDKAYIEKIMEYYDYRIDGVRTEGDIAQADVTVTSIDMKKVLLSYRQKLIDYAHTAESISGDSITLNNTSAALLMEALTQDGAPASYPVSIRLMNDGSTWQLTDSSGLANALLGNISEALDAMNSAPAPLETEAWTETES